MKRIFATILLVFIGIGLFAGEGAEHAVRQLSLTKFEWLINRQTDSLQLYLHDKLRYIHSNGLVETKAEMIANNLSGDLVYKAVSIDQMEIRSEGQLAIVTGRGIFSGILYGKAFEADLMFTEVYVLKAGNWLLLSRHANLMP